MQKSFQNGDVKIFAGPTSKRLVKDICKILETEPGKIELKRFSDGEPFVRYEENVRNKHVVIVQSSGPKRDNLVFLCEMIDAAKRSAAAKVTAIIPYLGFSRQERKDSPRTPLTCKWVAGVIDKADPDWLVFNDLHAGAIAGFFNTPSDHIYMRPVFMSIIKERFPDIDNLVIVAPDVGASKMCRSYAKRLGIPLAIGDKRRPEQNKAEITNIIGEVKGKDCLIIDDMIDTAGTYESVVAALHKYGAKTVQAMITHPVLSGKAVERIKNSKVEWLVVGDSINLGRKAKQVKKIEVASQAHMWAEAIDCIQTGRSLSALFEKEIPAIMY